MKKKLIALLIPLFVGALYLSTTHAMNLAPEGQVKKPVKSALTKAVKKWVITHEDLCVAGAVIGIRLGDGELFKREELFDLVKNFVPEGKLELVREAIQFGEAHIPLTVEGATECARQKLKRCAVFLKNIAIVLVVTEEFHSLPEKIGFPLTVLLVPLTLVVINQLNFNSITTAMALQAQKLFKVMPSLNLAELHEEARAGVWRKNKGRSGPEGESPLANADGADWSKEELLIFRVLNGNLTQKQLQDYVGECVPVKRRVLANELLRVAEKRMPLSVEAREKANKDGASKFSRFVSDGIKGMIVWEGSKWMLELAGPGAAVVTIPVVAFSLYSLDDSQLIKWGQKLGVLVTNVVSGLTQWMGGNKAKAKTH